MYQRCVVGVERQKAQDFKVVGKFHKVCQAELTMQHEEASIYTCIQTICMTDKGPNHHLLKEGSSETLPVQV